MQVLALAVLALVLAVVPSLGKALQDAKRSLVPSRRFDGLEARDLRRGNIAPHSAVQLNYGLAPHYPPIAYVECTAHDNYPILMLEDVDHLFDGVSCSSTFADNGETDTMNLIFSSYDTFLDAFELWTDLEAVLDVWADLAHLTVKLMVKSTPLHLVGQACRIQYSHMAAGRTSTHDSSGLYARDVHEFTDSQSAGFDETDLGPRFTIWPAANDTLVNQIIQQDLGDVDLQLTCVDCSFSSNMSIAFDIQYTVNASCLDSNASCFTLNKAGFNVTILEFDQVANLEVALGDEFSYSANWTIFPVPDVVPLKFDGITVGPSAGVEIGFSLDISAAINFTYGAQAHVPPGTFASFDLLDATGNWNPNVNAKGWDQINITQIPFRVNSGQFNVTAELWLAPFAEIEFEIEEFGAVAEILAHTPMVTVDADMLTNVNRNCSAIGPDDFESFGLAFTVGAGMQIGPVAEFDVNAGKLSDILSDLNISTNYEDNFNEFTLNVPLYPANGTNDPKCFVLSDDSETSPPSSVTAANALVTPTATISTLAGVPATTGTMFPAASAVPTWDFQKIESYSSANGHLPTNVNYKQMLQATTVPSQLLNAVKAASSAQRPTWCKIGYLISAVMVLGFIIS
ncbi:hypothetical protein NM688_g2422 [Phlebia brevispora]|uniref:Uncharacterized protein n=1 Tax=Phlebia brevispora TaxID=194682 RepID=A0ACC1T8U7_9APHY|nr:hypothetical protein NM688_g2422 [Phlebia brevispora]